LLPKLGQVKWDVLGVVATEDRCEAIMQGLDAGSRGTIRFLRIEDPDIQTATSKRLDDISTRIENSGVPTEHIRRAELLADIDTIGEEVAAFLDLSGPNIVLDITSMPKWWFFPAIRMILAREGVKNFVVTYASAIKYDDDLSSDLRPLSALPTFGSLDGRTNHDELIVGIGFAQLGLKDLYSEDIKRVSYLFPFPPGPPFFGRNWQFLRELETEIENRNIKGADRLHVHMYDCPAIFDALRSISNDGLRSTALAPFGPKTMSLAMCLFSLAAECATRLSVPVFYTQPQRYALHYTDGIKMVGGAPDIQAYCIRIAGRDLYQL
jgi:hypothetical protein